MWVAKINNRTTVMNAATRASGLKYALVLFGVICFLIYPLALVWPSGWIWHNGGGTHYFQMICGLYAVLGFFLVRAAKAPTENKSLIEFTIWSSVVHAGVMTLQVMSDHMETGHLFGDIPALIIVASVLWYLSPERG